MSNAIYAAFDGVTPATLLPEAVDELRDRLGFEGAIVSADLVATTATTGGSVGEAAIDALKAGVDLLIVPGGRAQQDEAYRAVVAAAAQPRDLARRGVADALRRIAELRALTRDSREPIHSARSRLTAVAAQRGRRPGERLAERDLVGVLEVAADRQAAGEARDDDVGARSRSASAMCSAVASPVVVGFVASTTSLIAAGSDPRVELGDLQVLGVDAVDRRQRAAEHVVAAAVLVRALDRDDVAGLLDDADEAAVAARRPGRSGSAARRRG